MGYKESEVVGKL